MTADLPHFVANAIDHRLAQIALHRADMSRLEELETLHEVERRILDQVVGVEAAARGGGQSAVRPALELRETALQKRLGGHPIAVPGADHQLHGGLIAEQNRLGLFRQRTHAWCVFEKSLSVLSATGADAVIIPVSCSSK